MAPPSVCLLFAQISSENLARICCAFGVNKVKDLKELILFSSLLSSNITRKKESALVGILG